MQQNVTIDVPGTMTRPPNGTYTYGVMLIDNTFGITQAMQFDEAVTGQDGTSGYFVLLLPEASSMAHRM